MIIYNVTVKVTPQIAGEWLQWMKEQHINEMVATGLFTDARISRLLEQDETEGSTYIVQYFCESIADYETYVSQHSSALREKGLRKFGGQMIAFRTIMETESGNE